MQIVSGRYTGTGSAHSPVTNLPWQPSVVIVKSATQNASAVCRMSTMNATHSKPLNGALANLTTGITSLDANGFSVGNSNTVNVNGVVHYYIALRDNSAGDLTCGSYTGDGVNDRNINDLSFQPDMIITMSETVQKAVWRTSDMSGDNSQTFNTALAANLIQAINATGFQVGDDVQVNENAIGFHYIALKNVTNVFKVFTYTGNGADNTSYGGVGFRAHNMIVKNASAGTDIAAIRFKSQVGDLCCDMQASEAANLIQRFESDGFQAGTDSQVNSTTVVYYNAAFRDGETGATPAYDTSYCCGGECGVIGEAGSHLPVTAGTAPTIITATKRTGARAISFAGASAASTIRIDTVLTLASPREFVGRYYVYFPASLPTGDLTLAFAGISAGSFGVAYFKASDSKIYAAYDNALPATNIGATGISVVADTWYRIDLKVDNRANPRLCDVQVDGQACGQASTALAAADLSNYGFGCIVSPGVTYEFYLDDILVTAGFDSWPIGAGYVNKYSPNGDGTHLTGTAGNFTDAAGTNITDATTDAYTHVDDVPMGGGADNVEQRVASTTNYVELTFEDSAEDVAPQGVDYLIEYKGAAANAYTGSWALRDGTFEEKVALSPATGVTQRYMVRHFPYPPSGLPWTDTLFDGLRTRIGYSGDATPDVQFESIMLEAAFKTVSAAVVGSGYRTLLGVGR